MAGNLIRVATPVRKPHLGGILSVADVHDVPDSSRLASGGSIDWDANACGLMVAAPGMCEAPAAWPTADKADTGTSDDDQGGIVFPGYYGVECFFGPEDDSEMRAVQGITDGEGVFVDQVVTQYLLSTAASGGSAADLLSMLGLADSAVAASYPTGLGALLMNRTTAIKLAAAGALGGKNETGLLYTPTGTPVVPLSVPTNDTVTADAIFGTGSITVQRTPIHTFDGQDLTHNTHLRIAERAYGVYFDCLQPVKFSISAG